MAFPGSHRAALRGSVKQSERESSENNSPHIRMAREVEILQPGTGGRWRKILLRNRDALDSATTRLLQGYCRERGRV